MQQAVKKIVIAGGGTAGWVAAAALSKKLSPLVDVTLIESEAIGTVGVGEATIPPMRVFHSLLGIDEQEFMRATEATFKLGISFENWGKQGESYIHPFGTTGQSSYLAEFQHFWLHGQTRGITAPYSDYCLELKAAEQHKFAIDKAGKINFAYHLDAGKYALFLRQFSEKLGVKRIEGQIEHVTQHPSGDIKSLQLANGQTIDGDLFIDCTGFKGLLIEQTLKTGYQDWSHWLPCDTAVAVQTEFDPVMLPYTRAIAHQSGWQWRIPLQHRTGNGLVFCSQYMQETEAEKLLLANLDQAPINHPRFIRYKTGRRKQFWNKNCLALGLSSGFVEPLESTSIYLFMNGIIRLMRMFPFNGITQSVVDEYNQQSTEELENVRDFIILHYHVTQRDDSEFWRYCRNMKIPDSLAHRIELFKEQGHAFQNERELFRLESWTHVMLGQGIYPQSWHQIFSTMTDQELSQYLNNMRDSIMTVADKMPLHRDFIKQYCAAPAMS
ncbi:tryptophan halogenase family protein [Neptunicella marina]|uniref:Tryptophan 7-halogenase n=1 Tax=Neptunicella marina TaxID=2125989 RepID=A0A8J6LYH8_9ALTE|nr:tryptophan halogenase family protein [Neptunicella marina]MBC3766194.1 tryptophan 7-halogenase [Neptunicella marina]